VIVVLLGDPYFGRPVGAIPTSKVFTLCHENDIVCTTAHDGDFTTHLNYVNDAPAAAEFIVDMATQWFNKFFKR
jgi:cutinase